MVDKKKRSHHAKRPTPEKMSAKKLAYASEEAQRARKKPTAKVREATQAEMDAMEAEEKAKAAAERASKEAVIQHAVQIVAKAFVASSTAACPTDNKDAILASTAEMLTCLTKSVRYVVLMQDDKAGKPDVTGFINGASSPDFDVKISSEMLKLAARLQGNAIESVLVAGYDKKLTSTMRDAQDRMGQGFSKRGG